MLGELEPFTRELIDMRSRKELLPVTTQISVAGIIEEKIDDIRFLSSLGKRGADR